MGQICSGLPVVRRDAGSIGEVLGLSFKFIESRRHDHRRNHTTVPVQPISKSSSEMTAV